MQNEQDKQDLKGFSVLDGNKIIFEQFKVRRIWNRNRGQWYFSIVDVIAILTSQTDFQKARKYWNKFNQRLRNKNQSVTDCHRLKLVAKDGKRYFTDVVGVETIFHLIEFIPSPKAEPFRLWLARIGWSARWRNVRPSPTLKIQFTQPSALLDAGWKKSKTKSNTFPTK